MKQAPRSRQPEGAAGVARLPPRLRNGAVVMATMFPDQDRVSAEVPAHEQRTGTRRYAALGAVLALILGGLGGFFLGRATTPEKEKAVTKPVSSSPPTAVDYSGAKLVTGRDVFSITERNVTSDAVGRSHSRDAMLNSTITCADPRVAGTAVGTWNSDNWGSSLDNGALVQWGKYTITNAGGSWIGTLTGVATTATSDVITWWLTGTGKYAGWSMYMWETPGLMTPDNEEGYPFTALIFPGKPPTP